MKSKHIITICGNAEVVTDGRMSGATDCRRDDACQVYCDAAASVVKSHRAYPVRVDYEVDADFHAWRGGLHDQFRQKYGCVSHERDAPKYVIALARLADHIGERAMTKFIAKLAAAENNFAVASPAKSWAVPKAN